MEADGDRTTEAGQAEPILLLHGSLSSGVFWGRHREILEAHGYRPLTPDLIGYGRNALWPGPRPFRLEDEITHLRGLLPVDQRPYHLVGHSYGGVVALGLAARHPTSVASLTLIEPVAFSVLRDAEETAAYAEVAGIRDAYLAEFGRGHGEAAVRGFVDYWMGAGVWTGLPESGRAEILRVAPKIALDWEAAFGADLGPAALRAIRSRVLLIHGGQSPFPTRRLTTALSGMLSCAELRVIEEAGHGLPLTHPIALLEALLAHVQVGACCSAVAA